MRKTFILLAIVNMSLAVNAQFLTRELLLGEDKKSELTKFSPTESETLTSNDYIKLNQQGVKMALDEQDYREALRFFQKALEVKPDCYVCLYNIGRSNLVLKQYTAAVEIFNELIRRDPTFANVYASLGEALSEKGLALESLKAFENAVRLNPEDPVTLTNYAVSLHNTGEYKKALIFLDKALKIDPELAGAHSNRGLTLYALKKYKECQKSLEKARSLSPETAEIYNNLGVLADQLGKEKKAVEYFLEAVRLKPEYAQAHYNLALSYLAQGNRAEAYEQLALLEKYDFILASQLRQTLYGRYVLDASVPQN